MSLRVRRKASTSSWLGDVICRRTSLCVLLMDLAMEAVAQRLRAVSSKNTSRIEKREPLLPALSSSRKLRKFVRLKHIFILFNLGDPINRYDRAMLECLSDLLKNHPRGVKMQPVFTKLDKLARRNAPGKIIKARETLHNLAPDALEPWYLVRAGGKPSQWVGVEEMQRAALLGAGLSVPKPAKTVSAPPGIDTSRARTARGPLNAANT